MNKDFKAICKGNYKIVKYSGQNELIYYYEGNEVKREKLNKLAKYYSRECLVNKLNNFIETYSKKVN